MSEWLELHNEDIRRLNIEQPGAKIERLTADIERLEDSFVVMMRESEAAHTVLTEEVESWQRVAKDLSRELVSAGQIVAERDATLVDLQLAAQKALKDAAHEIALQDVKIERMTYERSHPFIPKEQS